MWTVSIKKMFHSSTSCPEVNSSTTKMMKGEVHHILKRHNPHVWWSWSNNKIIPSRALTAHRIMATLTHWTVPDNDWQCKYLKILQYLKKQANYTIINICKFKMHEGKTPLNYTSQIFSFHYGQLRLNVVRFNIMSSVLSSFFIFIILVSLDFYFSFHPVDFAFGL